LSGLTRLPARFREPSATAVRAGGPRLRPRRPHRQQRSIRRWN